MERSILIAAGGTGGHLFPGIAVADEVRRRDAGARIVFVGTHRGLEGRLVPRAGYPLERLPILPLNAVGFARALRGVCALPWALVRAARLVVRLRPSAVLGVGGYAGGPVVLVAALLGVPTLVLEPNARPGFTNRVLRPFVRRAACAYEETLDYYGAKGVLTGNPVRGGFASLPRKVRTTPMTLLAFGGSQGSRILNETMTAALPHLKPERGNIRLFHQTGKADFDKVKEGYVQNGFPEAEVAPFFFDMAGYFEKSDLVVSRAGATTIAELIVAQKAAVLVPFALASEDHQVKNAAELERVDGAEVILEKDLTPRLLAERILFYLKNPERISAMERNLAVLKTEDPAGRIAALCFELMREKG